jgi:hypothetical protein
MFVHTVHFWLKPDLTASERAAFLAGLHALADSPNVARVRIGKPAGTPRPVVDNSYDFQLLVEFTDQAAHDRYQSADDPAHETFIRTFKPMWTRVLIYDSVPV